MSSTPQEKADDYVQSILTSCNRIMRGMRAAHEDTIKENLKELSKVDSDLGDVADAIEEDES